MEEEYENNEQGFTESELKSRIATLFRLFWIYIYDDDWGSDLATHGISPEIVWIATNKRKKKWYFHHVWREQKEDVEKWIYI